ncbi:MAG TPA: tetratricopeptide repeat protein [Rhodanobacteraceae bacterium]|nr:tetratricopeptide repeat protein [Rhodanobacteraceae bacterium]
MNHRLARLALPMLVVSMLSACTATPPRQAAPVPVGDMLAAIHAAGRSEESVLSIMPLRPASLTLLLQQARSQTIRGNARAAAEALGRAHAVAPDDPEVLQLQAENAIRLHEFARAETLARQSWSAGSKVGALCARNWQTVYQLRRLAGDASGMAAAERAQAECHKPGIKRM